MALGPYVEPAEVFPLVAEPAPDRLSAQLLHFFAVGCAIGALVSWGEQRLHATPALQEESQVSTPYTPPPPEVVEFNGNMVI